jgi:hypothetical protein
MNDFDFSMYDYSDTSPSPESHKGKESTFSDSDDQSFDFSIYDPEEIKLDEEESFLKSAIRSALQPFLGYAKKATYPADIAQMIGVGESLAELEKLEERLPELKKKFPQLDWSKIENIDREKYMEAVQNASKYFPTQSNVERGIEESTGIPLQPKDELQKALRLGGEAAGFKGGDILSKGTAAVVAPATSQALELAGAPEGLAELGGLVVSGATPTPAISKTTKPSGLITRRFEKTTKPTVVTPERFKAIKEKVETDFRKISDEIFSKNRTYSIMKEEPRFKEMIGDAFEAVDELAKQIPNRIQYDTVRKSFRDKINSKERIGFIPSEYEKEYAKQVKSILDEFPRKTKQDLHTSDIVNQFRKNNKSLTELFEPGKSSAANRAKKEALLDFNRSLEDVIKKEFPDSVFSEAFKFTNERWKDINDIEKIGTFVDEMFNGKIDYNKAKQIFNRDKEHIVKPFKRLLGEENFNNFKVLMNDLLSTEKAMSLIKKAEAQGYGDAAKDALLLITRPELGQAKFAAKYGKEAWQMLLDKPQLTIKWDNALKHMKDGVFDKAMKEFSEVDKELSKGLSTSPKSNQRSPKKT